MTEEVRKLTATIEQLEDIQDESGTDLSRELDELRMVLEMIGG